MTYSTKYQNYTYIHGDVNLNFESAVFKRGTYTSEYNILDNQVQTTINGNTPIYLTLKGKFLPSDFESINTYIASNTGLNIPNFSLNGHIYSGMILMDGHTEMDISNVFGEMTLIFKSM